MNEATQIYLNIIDGQGNTAKLCLGKLGKSIITIGTDETNDITLPKKENYVSRKHGVIRLENGRIYYRDINNSNGSYVISPSFSGYIRNPDFDVEIEDNSVIRIGNMSNSKRMTVLWFTYLTENENLQRIPLADKVSIGRDASNDIVLSNPYISKTHAIVATDVKEGCSIYDDSLRGGILVNGRPINGSAVLMDKDIIQILGFQLIYTQNSIFYKKKASGIAIRAIGVNKVVEKNKRILRDVNIEIKGNEFVAIIGGSGAGKSTIMGVLNGFDKNHSGEVYYNNISVNKYFNSIKDIIGYVPQEDIVYENLTLRDMLRYSAELRMPSDQSNQEIENRIDEVLATLDLTHHQNTYIRKLSGGQKKRASIAVELLADPKVFFLDEPTSGLDPGTEKSLMEAMRRLSKEQERTIIMVTHTTQSLHLCDRVIFMGTGGVLCFAGSVEEAKKFFGQEDLTEIYNMMAEDSQKWAVKYATLNSGSKIRREEGTADPESDKRSKVSGLHQFRVVFERYIKLCLNDRRKLGIQMITPIIMGLIIWFIADETFLDSYAGTKSILFTMSCAAIWIGLFAAIQEVCKERSILKREYMASLRLPSYIGAKFTVLFIQSTVQTILLTLVGFVMLGIKYSGSDDISLTAMHTLIGDDEGITWEIFITLWLTMIAAVALGLLISSLFKNSDKATTIAPFVLIIQLVFSGTLFELDGAKEVISYVTFSRWSVDALGRITNLKEYYDFLFDRDEGMFDWAADKLLTDWGILFAMTIVCLIASTIILRSISKDGR